MTAYLGFLSHFLSPLPASRLSFSHLRAARVATQPHHRTERSHHSTAGHLALSHLTLILFPSPILPIFYRLNQPPAPSPPLDLPLKALVDRVFFVPLYFCSSPIFIFESEYTGEKWKVGETKARTPARIRGEEVLDSLLQGASMAYLRCFKHVDSLQIRGRNSMVVPYGRQNDGYTIAGRVKIPVQASKDWNCEVLQPSQRF